MTTVFQARLGAPKTAGVVGFAVSGPSRSRHRPASQTPVVGEVIVMPPPPSYVDLSDPLSVRAAWMRLQGNSEEEIAEYCDPDRYPAELPTELENLHAARQLRQ